MEAGRPRTRARPGAIGGGVTPSGLRPVHLWRRSRPRCAAGSASAATRIEEPVPLDAIEPRAAAAAPARELSESSAPTAGSDPALDGARLPRRRPRLPRAGSTGPPTWSPSRATRRTSGGCSSCAPTAGWRRSPSAAARASSAGSSPGSDTATAGPSRSTSARSSGIARDRRGLGSALIRAGTLGPDLEDGLRPARADPAPLPAVVRVLDPRRLDRDPGGRSFRDPADPHRRPRRLDPGADADAASWESRRLPGSGAGPSPDRMMLGSEGILGVITEAWVRVRPRPALQGLAAGPLRELRRRSGGGAGDLAVGPPSVELPVARSARGGDHRGRRTAPPPC